MKRFFVLLILIMCGLNLFADELLQVRAQNSDYDFVLGYALVSDAAANRLERKLGDEFFTTGLYYTNYSINDWELAVSNIRQTARNSGLSVYIADKSYEKIALVGSSASLLKAKKALGYMFLE